jgi:predicted histidine transporter YuiF (NhaC family)
MIQKRNRDEQPVILEFKEDSVRKSLFENGLRSYAVSGYIIESKNDFDAIITKQNRTNHLLHACITFIGGALTCGVLCFWIIPWLIISIINKNPERHAFWVDEYGRMQIKKLHS